MSQPAKSHEPSMEEILASIRRIIAEDDSAKVAPQSPEPPIAPAAPGAAARSAAPFVAPSEPFLPELEPPADLGSIGSEPDQSSDIFDLTESMAAEPSPPAPEPEPPVASARPEPRSVPVPEPQFFAHEHSSEAMAVEMADEMAEMSALRADSEEHAFDGGDQRAFGPAHDHAELAHERGGERQLLSSETSAAVDSAFNALAQTVLVQNARTLEDLVREMLRPMLKAWLDDNLPGMVERLVRAEIERVSRGR